jgi:hypothetical protein
MAHGRSPLGYLERLRVLVFVLPLLTAIALVIGGRKDHGAFINPQSLAEIEPAIIPLMLAAAAATFASGLMLGPQSPLPMRYFAIAVTYVLALVSLWVATVYWLAGASPLWPFAGLALAIGAVRMVSLARFAHDVRG